MITQSQEGLWQWLLAREDLLQEVIARMTPASIRQLRLAALPGSDSDSRGMRLLRPPLLYHQGMSEQQLSRVVEVPLMVLAGADRLTALRTSCSECAAALQAARLFCLCVACLLMPSHLSAALRLPWVTEDVLCRLASACASTLTRLAILRPHIGDDGDTHTLPAQLSQLTSLRSLQLGHTLHTYCALEDYEDEGLWQIQSVAPLQALAGVWLCLQGAGAAVPSP